MTLDQMAELFEKHDALYHKAPEGDDTTYNDVRAFVLLEKLCPDDSDMVAAAEHDHIWLRPDVTELARIITEEQIIELIRCGVMYDDETASLNMFA